MANCPLLGDLEGLSNLEEVRGLVTIGALPGLGSLGGLRNLGYVDRLIVFDNDALVDLEGLGSLSFPPDYNGSLQIDDNASLASLAGLAAGDEPLCLLSIVRNPSLLDLTGLEHVVRAGAVNIDYNDGLTSLTGLGNVEELSRLELLGNPSLASLGALSALTMLHSSFEARHNDFLPTCEAQALIGRLGDVPDVWIDDNDDDATCP